MTSTETLNRKHNIGWTEHSSTPSQTCKTCLYASRKGNSCLLASIVTRPLAGCRHWAELLPVHAGPRGA